ncbi:2894_t:CDS:2 [Entrophospora sp. SA101]|nr:2894_t:CDS:2 [Entrophospora sp. SA101]
MNVEKMLNDITIGSLQIIFMITLLVIHMKFLMIGCLEEIRDEHSTSISNNSVISILRSRAFFEDVGYLANTLLPIKLAILEVEGRSTNLADCYISLLRIAAVIRNLPSNDYKFFRNHCISVLIKGKNHESWESLSTQIHLYKL